MENPACSIPAPASKGHVSVGKVEKLCGLDVYFNWPAGATQAIVLVADVFGWSTPLFRKLADKIADAGYISVAPDFLKGDPLDLEKYPMGSGGFNVWRSNHPQAPVVEDTWTIITALKDKGIKSIGLAGFCYGGVVAVLVAAKEGAVDVTAVLHPGPVTIEQLKATKGPFAILTAEVDRAMPLPLLEEFQNHLKSRNEVEHFVKIYPGVEHGWSVRYDENDEKAVKSAYEAQSDLISWFNKCLK